MQILQEQINFDRFVRGGLLVAVVAVLVLAINYLSPVLVPFFLAWALAWLLIPVVKFFQYKLKFRYRTPSVLAAIIVFVLGVTGVLLVTLPIFVEGFVQLKQAILDYLSAGNQRQLPTWLQRYFNDYIGSLQLEKLLKQENVVNALKTAVPKAWDMLISTANIAVGIASSLFGVLYLIFILSDYERFSTDWIHFVPRSKRPFVSKLVSDVANGMRGYLRGQALIALSNMIMFTIGFWLIGLKMWLGMGIFVGLISFIPYVQVIGFIPAAVLALLEMAEVDGRPFWLIMLLVLLVYGVVQVIQDAVVTPRVMGKIMGLSPAIVLLSLSIWGSLAGIIGLIVALPLTTILIAYYRKYIIGRYEDPESPDGPETPELPETPETSAN